MILPQLGRSENMRLPEEFEESNNGKPMIYMFAGVCAFIVLLFAVMIMVNAEPGKKSQVKTDTASDVIQEDNTESAGNKSELVSDDLDFWGMYPNEDESEDDDD